jgi:polyhydroxybutyrate depolymerase
MTKTILYAIAAALIAVTALAFAAPAQQPERSGAAPYSGPRTYRFDQTIRVGASERSFTLNLPPTYYDSRARVPLVIALHGGGGSGAQFEATSGLTQKADAAQVAVVYPDGTARAVGLRTWNGGGCCGHAVAADIDDVEFMRQLIAHLTANYRINRKRVYVAGHSNGGILAYRLACELPERIAAIAANAAALRTRLIPAASVDRRSLGSPLRVL